MISFFQMQITGIHRSGLNTFSSPFLNPEVYLFTMMSPLRVIVLRVPFDFQTWKRYWSNVNGMGFPICTLTGVLQRTNSVGEVYS
jgi:hypothetical protein